MNTTHKELIVCQSGLRKMSPDWRSLIDTQDTQDGHPYKNKSDNEKHIPVDPITADGYRNEAKMAEIGPAIAGVT